MDRRGRLVTEDTGEWKRGAGVVDDRFEFLRSRRQTVPWAMAQSPEIRGGKVVVEQLRRMVIDAGSACLRKQMVDHFPLPPRTARQYHQESLELQDEAKKGRSSHSRWSHSCRTLFLETYWNWSPPTRPHLQPEGNVKQLHGRTRCISLSGCGDVPKSTDWFLPRAIWDRKK